MQAGTNEQDSQSSERLLSDVQAYMWTGKFGAGIEIHAGKRSCSLRTSLKDVVDQAVAVFSAYFTAKRETPFWGGNLG